MKTISDTTIKQCAADIVDLLHGQGDYPGRADDILDAAELIQGLIDTLKNNN